MEQYDNYFHRVPSIPVQTHFSLFPQIASFKLLSWNEIVCLEINGLKVSFINVLILHEQYTHVRYRLHNHHTFFRMLMRVEQSLSSIISRRLQYTTIKITSQRSFATSLVRTLNQEPVRQFLRSTTGVLFQGT